MIMVTVFLICYCCFDNIISHNLQYDDDLSTPELVDAIFHKARALVTCVI